jgi:hypothetical protein
MHCRTFAHRGLALVEVVVISAIALVAIALIIPAVHAAQIFAKRARSENNLKMIALASANYESAYGTFAMSRVASPDPKQRGVGHSGFTSLLPFLEQQRVFNAYNFDLEPWDATNNTAVRTRINEYVVVENKDIASKKADQVTTLDDKPMAGKNEFGPLHFGMNWGGGHRGFGDDFVKINGKYRGIYLPVVDAEGKAKGVRNVGIAQIIDGTSFTIGMMEKRDSSGWAIGGFGGSEFDVNTEQAYRGDDAKARRVFSGTVTEAMPHVGLVDGSVRKLNPKLDKKVWYALLTRDGTETIPQDAFEK